MSLCNKNPLLRRRFCHPMAYVCCGSSSSVAVVDLCLLRQVDTIPCGAGSEPYYIAVHPFADLAYVADLSQERVLVLDIACNRVIDEFPVAGSPREVTLSACGHFLYVVFIDAALMQVFSTQTLQLLWQMSLPVPGGGVCVPDNGRHIYVTLPGENQTAVVDLCSRRIVKRLDTGEDPGRMAASPDGSQILVAGRASKNLTAIDTCQMCVQGETALTGSPGGLAYINRQECLVAMRQPEGGGVVDAHCGKLIKTLPVGELPGGVAAAENCSVAVVCNQISDSLSVINTKTYAATTVAVGNGPTGVVIVE